MSARKKDFDRCEGVYASIEIYPPPPLIGGIGLVKIERVCGDCTVQEMTIAPSEAVDLLEQLKILCEEKSCQYSDNQAT